MTGLYVPAIPAGQQYVRACVPDPAPELPDDRSACMDKCICPGSTCTQRKDTGLAKDIPSLHSKGICDSQVISQDQGSGWFVYGEAIKCFTSRI